MSVRLESANSERVRFEDIGAAADGTFFIRFYLTSLPGAGQVAAIISLFDTSGSFSGFQVHVDENGKLSIDAYDSGDAGPGSTTLTTGTFYTLGVTVDQTGGNAAVSVYLDGATTAEVSSGTVTYTGTSVRLNFGSWRDGGDYLNGRIHSGIWWSDVKTAAALAAQTAACTDPYTSTNLVAQWPLAVHTDLTDHFGAFDLTASGTLSTEADPAVCSPAGPIAGSGGWGWPRWLGASIEPVGGASSGLYYIWRRRREGKPHE